MRFFKNLSKDPILEPDLDPGGQILTYPSDQDPQHSYFYWTYLESLPPAETSRNFFIVTLGEGNLVMKEGAWKLGDAAHTELLNKVPIPSPFSSA